MAKTKAIESQREEVFREGVGTGLGRQEKLVQMIAGGRSILVYGALRQIREEGEQGQYSPGVWRCGDMTASPDLMALC